MITKKQAFFFLFLCVLAPSLSFIQANAHGNLMAYKEVLYVFLGFLFFFYSILWLLPKGPKVFFLLIASPHLFFMYDLLYLPYLSCPHYIQYVFFTLLFLGVLSFVAHKQYAHTFLKYFTVFFLIPKMYGVGLFFLKQEEANHASAPIKFKKKPNVYFIIIDAYGRGDMIEKYYQYNSKPFAQEMQKLGFSILKNAHSNYHATQHSLSATMMMEYHTDGEDKRRIKPGRKNAMDRVFNESTVVQTFKSNGYEFSFIAPGVWSEFKCGYAVDRCFGDALVSREMAGFFKKTPLSFLMPTFLNYFPYTAPKEILHALNGGQKPQFVYMHLAQVHDHYFTEKCQRRSVINAFKIGSKGFLKDYVHSIECMNKKILRVLDQVISKDPKAIVIVQGDHGPKTYLKPKILLSFGAKVEEKDPDILFHEALGRSKSIQESRLSILSAMRIPEFIKNHKLKSQYLYDSLSSVNTFRMLFSYLSEQSIPYLEDRHFISTKGFKKFIELKHMRRST